MAAPLRSALRVPYAIGDAVLRLWLYVAGLLGIVVAVAQVAVTPRRWTRTVRSEVVLQCYIVAVGAAPFLLALAALAGAALVAQAFLWLSIAGQTEMLGRFLVLGLVRETAPLTVALVVMGRSGTAIIADLATMKATGQVRALDAHGIDPFIFLVVPRVLAMTLAISSLTLLFIYVALFSGYAIARAADLTTITLGNLGILVLKALGPADGIGLLLKTLLPGVVMSAVCCRCAMSVERSVTEIPRAIMGGFAQGVTAMALINLAVSVLVYF